MLHWFGRRFCVATLNEIRRKLMVCITCECNKCPLLSDVIPEDCENIIKHALVKDDEGEVVAFKPRRSGKTREIMKMAMDVINSGYDVIVVLNHNEERYRLQKQYMGTGIQFLSISTKKQDFVNSVFRNLHGLDKQKTVFFSDNLPSWVAEEVKSLGYRFIFGYE